MYAGIHLADAMEAAGISGEQLYGVMKTEPRLAEAYAAARQFMAHLLVDDTIKLADSDADPAKVRNQILVRQWTASRINRKAYGDQVDVNVTQTVDIGSALLEARNRAVRSVSDQRAENIAEDVEYTEVSGHRPTDG